MRRALTRAHGRRPFFCAARCSERFAVDGEDLGVVDDAVDQRDHAGGIGEDLGPFGERAVRGQQQAFVLVAAAYDLEEQIGMVVAVGEVAHLVNFG